MEVTPERIEHLKKWSKTKLVQHIVKLEKTIYLIEKDYEVKRKEEKRKDE